MTNLSISLNGRFPNVLQSESLTVINQSDGFNVLPQLRQRWKRIRGVRRKEGTSGETSTSGESSRKERKIQDRQAKGEEKIEEMEAKGEPYE